MNEVPQTRFEMVKKRHSKTLKKAIETKKIDKEMIELCELISEKKEFFTSSGCSGRILLLSLTNRTKKDASFHRKWHQPIKPKKAINALKEETSGQIWLKVEPFIIHIGTNSLENARKVLATKNKAGIKRGGIIVAKPGKFVVELIGTDKMSVLLKKNKDQLASEKFIREQAIEANKKLERNYERLEKFKKTIKEELK